MASNDDPQFEIGLPAFDRKLNRIGIVTDIQSGRVQLRPLPGGVEWEAKPEDVGPLKPHKELSADLNGRRP